MKRVTRTHLISVPLSACHIHNTSSSNARCDGDMGCFGLSRYSSFEGIVAAVLSQRSLWWWIAEVPYCIREMVLVDGRAVPSASRRWGDSYRSVALGFHTRIRVLLHRLVLNSFKCFVKTTSAFNCSKAPFGSQLWNSVLHSLLSSSTRREKAVLRYCKWQVTISVWCCDSIIVSNTVSSPCTSIPVVYC